MSEILVIEDETAIRELVRLNCELAGYIVREAADGLEGLNEVRKQAPDLVLLDIMLPKMDGYALLSAIKKENVPVIFLTAKDSTNDKVKGLELGADDYIAKPFESLELLARIKAVLRRTGGQEETESIEKNTVTYQDIVMELDQHRIFLRGEEVALTLKEFELLLYLIEHKGSVVTREQLLSAIWGYDYEGNTRTVDMHVQRLRTKLSLETIKTVYKVGYRLEE